MAREEETRKITSEELSAANGKEGRPAYVAFEGKVFDVSKSPLWPKGGHMNRHASGNDLTASLSAAPHGPEVLERYPLVGTLKAETPAELKHLPSALQRLLERFPVLRRHPHPVMVHFPIAFLAGSSLFAFLHLVLQNPSLQQSSFHLLLLGVLASPLAIATGLFTWWVNYRLALTPLIRRKIQISFLLLIVEAAILLQSGSSPFLHRPLAAAMVLCLTPLVLLLGYYGGRMTFPTERPGR